MPWYWTNKHHESFEGIKHAIASHILLAYPNYNDVFEIYTDASNLPMGAVITQRRLELLSIVECLKEFKGMLWGQCIEVYMDQKNLVNDALGLSSDQ
ncbi:hypothetical protein ACHAW6_008302, partial [Cyclotella cf. meneghiniana]